jgi:acyl-CoA dehydrogenase
MPDRSFLSWPFFEARHRELADELQGWCADNCTDRFADDLDSECRMLVRVLGAAGFLKLTVAAGDARPDVRSLAIARETLAYHSPLADFAFAMQGLGSGAISLFGTVEQKREWLPKVASGNAVAAFAMTEPECGSDAANMQTSAMRDGNEWVLVGEKTLISNGGIAHWRRRRLTRTLRIHRPGGLGHDCRAHRRHRSASPRAPYL